ncbi:pre-peptidase C-terminal domain-containing protein [Streptomyces fructofermentans]|uniref:pre-peptidase C-terminal domain-containing protein n=1 Tax=Streptomyces fructofermentans TaxID=152141 RepID=UPI0033C608A6
MLLPFPYRSVVPAAVALLAIPGTVVATGDAQAAAGRARLGNAADVSRTTWNGPAFTMNGDGAVVPASAARAIDAIRGNTGTLDVVVLAGSVPASGSETPECDTVMTLTGVNSCTTWTLTATADGNNTQANADIRNAEFVYFAGGNQCRYTAWKGTALEASVESVIAKGGGSGGSAGHHINSPIVYDACRGSVTSSEALADPYDPSITFTTGMFSWPHYTGVVNDSHFVTRDRMGRTMAFVARALKNGLTADGTAWGVGVEEGGGSLFLDKNGLATQYGADAYVVLGDHAPEQAAAGSRLTFSNYKIWRLAPGTTFDFKNRPTCGYYRRSVTNGVTDADLYGGTPETNCEPTGGSALSESEPNDSRATADDATALALPAILGGSMKSSSDADYFKITLASGRRAAVQCSVPSAYDADLYLLDPAGATLERSVNDGAGADEALAFTRTEPGNGTYYIDVEAYARSGATPYSCALTAS